MSTVVEVRCSAGDTSEVTFTAAPALAAKVAVICYPNKNIDIIQLCQLHEEECFDLGSMPNFVSNRQHQAVPSTIFKPTVSSTDIYFYASVCIIIVAVTFVYF